MRLHLVTWLEVFGVLVGIVSLGSVGTLVTPKGVPSHPLLTLEENQPENVIDNARTGYQVDTCVREISPRTVLSESASGSPEFVVLEGAPVTECFPGLAEFIGEERARSIGTTTGLPSSRKGGAPGADMQTSVTVLPPLPASGPKSTSSSVTSGTSSRPTETFVVASSTPSSDAKLFVPSGGATTGGGGIPPVSRFDACRIRLFGEVIPVTLTPAEETAFEQCLQEGSLP
jgi:hypothetical protein